MDDRKEDNTSMKLTVESILTKYQGNWIAIPRFADAVTDFRAKLSQIENQRKVQEKHTKGAADLKTANRMVMCEDAALVAKIVKAYAQYNHDPVLKNIVDYSYTDLFKTRDTDSKIKCQDIYDAALPIQADLTTNYGLNPMAIPNLDSAITAYDNVIMAPTTAKGVRKTAGSNLTQLVKETDGILKDSIDNMMEPFKNTVPDFYKEYKSARIIINLGRRGKAAQAIPSKLATISGKVTDASGKALKGVTCVLIGLTKNYTTITDKNGVYTFAGAVDDTYTLQIILNGKKMIIVKDIALKADNKIVKNFMMEAEAGNETATKLK